MLPLALALVYCLAADDPVDFTRDVAPILKQQCLRCHRDDDAKGGLSLASPDWLGNADLIVPGRPDESYLLDLVQSGSDGARPEMPKSGSPLTASQVDTLRRWIASGAPWPSGLTLADRSRADQSWWSLQPLGTAGPPAPAGLPDAWASHPIDRFIYETLATQRLAPSPPADRRTLLRRLSYDLIGLPPTAEEIQAFESDDSPSAYDRQVDRLLADPRYGERWARHWLDVVRFGESRGFERNEIIPNAWPFRDYIIRSLNENVPFDRLVQEHLAGDLIGKDDPSVEIGATFLVAGPYDDVGNQDADQAAQIRANTVDDVIVATGSAFLGLTIGCARCHDHKFDPISQADYYRWYATFDDIQHGSREVASPADRQARDARLNPLVESRVKLEKERADLIESALARDPGLLSAAEAGWTRPPAALTGVDETFEPVQANQLRLTVSGTDANPAGTSGYHIDELEIWSADDPPANVALADFGTKVDGPSRVAGDFSDGYSAAQAIDGKIGATWFAAGPTLTLTFPRPVLVRRVVFSSNRDGNFHRTFPAEYRLEASSDGSSWTEVASGRDRKPVSEAHRRHRLLQLATDDAQKARLADLDRQLAETNAAIAAVPPLPSWWVGTSRHPPETRLFQGGDPRKKGDPIVAASLGTLERVVPAYSTAADSPGPDRRLALARWITDPSNPLTPRVLANRLWHYHFGRGLVSTPADFGFMGSKPTHPQLLDWLSRELLSSGWDLKHLHRLIVTSQTYQQSSSFRPDAASADADDLLLWRFPPRRLEAEQIRDTMLQVSGVLDQRMTGPGFRLYQYLQDNVSTYVPLDRHGPDTYRRSIYHHNARAAPVDLFSEFDCPDNAFSAPRRDVTTSPLQALTMLNHSFTIDISNALASRIDREAVGTVTDRVDLLYRLAYGRSPTASERDAASAFLRDHDLPTLCRAIVNSNEFIYVD